MKRSTPSYKKHLKELKINNVTNFYITPNHNQKMNYYLSSYKFGDHIEALKDLIPDNNKIGYISNAGDWVGHDVQRLSQRITEEMAFLDTLGYRSEHLDLKTYFGKQNALKEKLDNLGGVWICGGNTFVLRQAMKLSGFDQLFSQLPSRKDFLYSGYSAGVCVLCDNLKPIDQVDDPFNFPYKGIDKPIYDGLGVFNYTILPHYKSHHFESEAIGKEVQRCIANKWPYKTLRDGEVIIIKE